MDRPQDVILPLLLLAKCFAMWCFQCVHHTPCDHTCVGLSLGEEEDEGGLLLHTFCSFQFRIHRRLMPLKRVKKEWVSGSWAGQLCRTFHWVLVSQQHRPTCLLPMLVCRVSPPPSSSPYDPSSAKGISWPPISSTYTHFCPIHNLLTLLLATTTVTQFPLSCVTHRTNSLAVTRWSLSMDGGTDRNVSDNTEQIPCPSFISNENNHADLRICNIMK